MNICKVVLCGLFNNSSPANDSYMLLSSERCHKNDLAIWGISVVQFSVNPYASGG